MNNPHAKTTILYFSLSLINSKIPPKNTKNPIVNIRVIGIQVIPLKYGIIVDTGIINIVEMKNATQFDIYAKLFLCQ